MNEPSAARSDSSTAALVKAVLEAPFHRFVGLRLLDQEPGRARAAFTAGGRTLAPGGTVHGGLLPALMDPTSYLALIPLLAEGVHAVTVDAHLSLIRPVPPGSDVIMSARVISLGGRLAFCDVEAHAHERLCASCRITKAVLRPR